MELLIIYLIGSFISFAIIAYLAKTPPLGHEDEDGFHYGDRTFASKEEAESVLNSEAEEK